MKTGAVAAALLACLMSASVAHAQGSPTPTQDPQPSAQPQQDAAPQWFGIHAQLTNIWQYNPAFRSDFQGPQSLDHHDHLKETVDATLYLGLAPWKGAELWVNPEVDQGKALGDTLGLAGFVNGEGAKVGKKNPYIRFQRLFFRQTVDLGGDSEKVDPDVNVLGGSRTKNRLVFTGGKFNATDIFDDNKYAHDPKQDFLNWSLIDAGSYDYAADAWGYSYGVAAEWYQGDWVGRFGLFDLSKFPNGKALTPDFSQFQYDAEVEHDHKLFGRDGKLKLTAFLSRGRLGSYGDAIRLSAIDGLPAATARVRKYRSKGGINVNLEQDLTRDLGLFARAGFGRDNVEDEEYTDIDRTVSGGLSLKGARWGRKDDVIAVAGVVNEIGKAHEAYLNDGGVGILVGDGMLPHPGDEHIVESFYNFAAAKWAHVTFDIQLIDNPAYNRDRGPVAVFGGRLHLQY